ncbi:ketosteroid isomerase-related protein [Novosphingobium terrae]|uniref:ketosteroid isomerase-related protein n=1 Tax=Novosphingobium terrae TaxID=2726189 RepID=UPI00197DEB24|nr:ketosteroid isomerase-related protein [Novosphingobium terrae]
MSAIALLERYYAAFNAGDRPAMLACLTDDVAHDINQGERQTGKAAFTAFLAHMDRCYAEQLSDITLMAHTDGTRAAAEFTVHGQYLATDEGLPEATGQRYVLPAGAFFTLRDGLICRISVYYNLPEWTRQVSL